MELVYMITIVDREAADNHITLFRNEGVYLTLKTLGKGTAKDEILKYLGLGETEKVILFTTMKKQKSKKILQILSSERNLNRPGAGVAFTIPVSSVCGNTVLNFLSGKNINGEAFEKMEAQKDTKYELLISISNRGYIDIIMDAARSAGAGGGTVIHALSTKTAPDEKFYGISVGNEKDLIMMVVSRETKPKVMKIIAESAGPHTKAGCVLFSLPVSGVAGIG